MMAVKEAAKRENKFTTVKLDKHTVDRLKLAADDLPVATFLRRLSFELLNNIDPVEVAFKESQRLLKAGKVDEEGAYSYFAEQVSEYLNVSRRLPKMSLIEQQLCENDLAKNPDAKQVGWHDRNEAGELKFNDARFDARVKEVDAQRAAMVPLLDELDRQDAVNLKKYKKGRKKDA